MLSAAVIKPYMLVVILVEIQLTQASHRIDIIKAENLQLNKQKVELGINRILINFSFC